MVSQRLYLAMFILWTIVACSSPLSTNRSTPNPSPSPSPYASNGEECPEHPSHKLEKIEPITLSNQKTIVSGKVTKGQLRGYIFEGKSGQKLSYQTNNNISLCIYRPDSEPLKSKEFKNLPITGKYIIEVAVLEGSTTFEIEISLGVMSLDRNQSSPNFTKNRTLERPSPEQFVINHYRKLNQRNYENTWQSLTSKFQNIAGSYSEYTKWWDSVQEIKISQVRLIEKNDNRVIVYANLKYIMKDDGRVSQDTKPHIHLIWDETSESWLFYEKTKSKAVISSTGVAIVFEPPSNVRKTPTDKENNILCSVHSRDTINIYELTNEWYKTDVCGSMGYIHKSQIKF